MVMQEVDEMARGAIRIAPGEFAISNRKPLYTLLGSCVSACLSDADIGGGGMNHFLLPEDPGGSPSDAARFGAFAMEQLINDLLRKGASRERMVAKITGGGRMYEGGLDIGQRNIAFVRQFLRTERIKVVAEHLGGTQARRVLFKPDTGQMFVRPVTSAQSSSIHQEEVRLSRASAVVEGTIDLF
ncbi:MAG: chemoreceptor glutamine deamidase CheD [Myxococcota bacterium]